MIFDVRRMEEMVYIVVPIFNTEKYLEQCLKSIHKQTYQNWKCLLVNDGSTDGCSQICETFASVSLALVSSISQSIPGF